MFIHRPIYLTPSCQSALHQIVNALTNTERSQTCGLVYQSFQATKCECDTCEHQPMNTNEELFPYILHQQQCGEATAPFPAVRLSSCEDEIFKGYRRVQIISQAVRLLYTRYPALQLMQDFRNFAELLLEAPADRWQCLASIRDLQRAASLHLFRASSIRAFSTISYIDQKRRDMAEETIRIRDDIDGLMNIVLDSDETKDLVSYIKQSMFHS